MIDSHNVKSIACLDEITENSRRSEPKEGLFEFRHRVAATDLAEIAAVLSRRTIRELTRDRIEPIGLAQQIIQGLLGAGAQFRNMHRWRDLEENVSRVHEITALELPQMTFVVTAAFFLGGRGSSDFPRQQGLDRLVDRCLVVCLGGQEPTTTARCRSSSRAAASSLGRAGLDGNLQCC